MTTLAWAESGDSWIETESDSYDYVIERGGSRYTLSRYAYDSDQLLSVVPCLTLGAAKTVAQDMENIVPQQKAKLTESVGGNINTNLLPGYGFSQPDWRD
jgi:hypothetical protein